MSEFTTQIIDRKNSESDRRHTDLLLEQVQKFYTAQGYNGVADADDIYAIALTSEEKICGVVRFAREHDLWILRGMFIAAQYQRKGLGTKLLLALESEIPRRKISNAWLICGSHLNSFYKKIGFHPVTVEAAPEFLQQRCLSYRNTYGEDQHILHFSRKSALGSRVPIYTMLL